MGQKKKEQMPLLGIKIPDYFLVLKIKRKIRYTEDGSGSSDMLQYAKSYVHFSTNVKEKKLNYRIKLTDSRVPISLPPIDSNPSNFTHLFPQRLNT